jgi:hypothetical protein
VSLARGGRGEIWFDDISVQKAFRRVEKHLQGRAARSWPAAEKFKKYKKGRTQEPWDKNGIDDRRRGNKWPSNAETTVRKKFGSQFAILWYSNQQKALVPMELAQKNYKEYMLGGGYMQKKRIPQRYKRRKLLEDTGTMRKSVNVTFSKKNAQFRLTLKKPIKRGQARTHLEGATRTQTFTKRTWRGKGKNRVLYLTSRTISWTIPARPWGVWTVQDLKKFIQIFKKWFRDEFKRGV